MAGATWWSWGFTKVRGWWVQWRFQQLHEIVIHKYDIGFTTVHLFIRDLNRHRKTLQRNPDQTTPLGRRIMLIDPGRSFNAQMRGQMVKWDNNGQHNGPPWAGHSDFMNIYKLINQLYGILWATCQKWPSFSLFFWVAFPPHNLVRKNSTFCIAELPLSVFAKSTTLLVIAAVNFPSILYGGFKAILTCRKIPNEQKKCPPWNGMVSELKITKIIQNLSFF